MAFFTNKDKDFPPENWSYWYNKYAEWLAWYSGDPERLLQFYCMNRGQFETQDSRFWARIEREERATAVHLPAAGDICSMSADLLFAEAPKIRYDQKTTSGKRINEFMRENGFISKLLEGAEIAAAVSGCFLKLDIDPDVVGVPILSIIDTLHAFPTFKWGRLWSVLFWRVVKTENNGSTVWRLFEDREIIPNGLKIQFKLYRGTDATLGSEVELLSIDETAMLGLKDGVLEGMKGLGVVYVPNKKPNKLDLGSPTGINDFSVCIPLMDSLDFAWTSWMRDIELGMGQLLIDEELLDKRAPLGRVEEATFSKFQKAFMRLNLSEWRLGGENIKPIENVQFDLRVEEHSKTCERLFSEIIGRAGYSEKSFGLTDNTGRAESGSALRIRERKSLLTREKKSRYWQHAIWELLYQMQLMDISSNLSSSYEVQEVEIELEDSIIIDPKETSETIRNIDQARAASTFVKVKLLHPEWETEDIDTEVQTILKEQGISNPPFVDEDEII